MLDIDKKIKSVNATSTMNLRGAATTGDLWSEEEEEEDGEEIKNKRVHVHTTTNTITNSVGIDSDSTLWDMNTRIAYERSILMSEMHRPLPSTFPRPQPQQQRRGAQFASYDKQDMFKKMPKKK
jgi:hypothetical protein